MDDNYIVNRIIDILENSNQNLLLGNINSPRPGSICQVNTDYGVKDAYNINCTYPGDAIVVWDNDVKQYYCFTDKPSEVISSRQLSYRKYKAVKKNTNKGNYILYGYTPHYGNNGDSNDITYFLTIDRVEATNIFFEKVIKKLNPKIKKLYIGIPDVNDEFLGISMADIANAIYNNPSYSDPNYLQGSCLRYLESKGIEIVFIKDTELDKVNDTLWIQPLRPTREPIFKPSEVNIIQKIAGLHGVLFETNIGSYKYDGFTYDTPIIRTYLKTFYNPVNTIKINDAVESDQIRSYMYSNLPDYLNIQINGAATALFDMNLIPKKYILATSVKANFFTGTITSDTRYASVIYW